MRILKNVEISYILYEVRSFTVISTYSRVWQRPEKGPHFHVTQPASWPSCCYSTVLRDETKMNFMKLRGHLRSDSE